MNIDVIAWIISLFLSGQTHPRAPLHAIGPKACQTAACKADGF